LIDWHPARDIVLHPSPRLFQLLVGESHDPLRGYMVAMKFEAWQENSRHVDEIEFASARWRRSAPASVKAKARHF
jgi:hypothetical protein